MATISIKIRNKEIGIVKQNRVKKKKNNFETSIEVTQGRIVRISGFLILFMGLFSVLAVAPHVNIKLPTAELHYASIITIGLLCLLIAWTYIILPYFLLTTKKKIIIKNQEFKILSNKKKYSFDTTMDKLVWWQKVTMAEWGDVLQLKFESKKLHLSGMEFPGLFKIEKLLQSNFKSKEKVRRSARQISPHIKKPI